MKWQTEIILFIICLNLATGVVTELGIPGTSAVSPSPQADASDYESHFDVEEVAEWKSQPFSGIPILGDVYFAFSTFSRMVSYIFVGFPVFLYSLGDNFITDPEGLVAFQIIAGAIGALFAVVMCLFLLWFISGREF